MRSFNGLRDTSPSFRHYKALCFKALKQSYYKISHESVAVEHSAQCIKPYEDDTKTTVLKLKGMGKVRTKRNKYPHSVDGEWVQGSKKSADAHLKGIMRTFPPAMPAD